MKVLKMSVQVNRNMNLFLKTHFWVLNSDFAPVFIGLILWLGGLSVQIPVSVLWCVAVYTLKYLLCNCEKKNNNIKQTVVESQCFCVQVVTYCSTFWSTAHQAVTFDWSVWPDWAGPEDSEENRTISVCLTYCISKQCVFLWGSVVLQCTCEDILSVLCIKVPAPCLDLGWISLFVLFHGGFRCGLRLNLNNVPRLTPLTLWLIFIKFLC